MEIASVRQKIEVFTPGNDSITRALVILTRPGQDASCFFGNPPALSFSPLSSFFSVFSLELLFLSRVSIESHQKIGKGALLGVVRFTFSTTDDYSSSMDYAPGLRFKMHPRYCWRGFAERLGIIHRVCTIPLSNELINRLHSFGTTSNLCLSKWR